VFLFISPLSFSLRCGFIVGTMRKERWCGLFPSPFFLFFPFFLSPCSSPPPSHFRRSGGVRWERVSWLRWPPFFFFFTSFLFLVCSHELKLKKGEKESSRSFFFFLSPLFSGISFPPHPASDLEGKEGTIKDKMAALDGAFFFFLFFSFFLSSLVFGGSNSRQVFLPLHFLFFSFAMSSPFPFTSPLPSTGDVGIVDTAFALLISVHPPSFSTFFFFSIAFRLTFERHAHSALGLRLHGCNSSSFFFSYLFFLSSLLFLPIPGPKEEPQS